MESTNAKPKAKPNQELTCLCGEHYVSALLAGCDLVVALPRGGAARSDLFVAESKQGRPVRLQVKTARDPHGKLKGRAFCSWWTSRRIIDTCDENLWFAFVALRGWPQGSDLPDVLFIPSNTVAECLAAKDQHKSHTYFWIYDSDAEIYRNAKGVERLKAAMTDYVNHQPTGPALAAD